MEDGDFVHRAAHINPLVHVTTLELALHPREPTENTHIPESSLTNLPNYFPNVTNLMLDRVNFSEDHILSSFCAKLSNLSRLSWKGGQFHVYGRAFDTLTEVDLDCCQLIWPTLSHTITGGRRVPIPNDKLMRFLSSEADHFLTILRYCRHLAHLSMKNMMLSNYVGLQQDPVSQEVTMKMVRLCPTLRWLKSDLTPENVAILQQERPDVTFVPI